MRRQRHQGQRADRSDRIPPHGAPTPERRLETKTTTCGVCPAWCRATARPPNWPPNRRGNPLHVAAQRVVVFAQPWPCTADPETTLAGQRLLRRAGRSSRKRQFGLLCCRRLLHRRSPQPTPIKIRAILTTPGNNCKCKCSWSAHWKCKCNGKCRHARPLGIARGSLAHAHITHTAAANLRPTSVPAGHPRLWFKLTTKCERCGLRKG